MFNDPEIIYEDKNLLAVNKPAGLLVHAGAAQASGKMPGGKGVKTGKKRVSTTKKEPTLVNWLLERYPEIKTVGDDPAQRPGIVHRLDKETSGVMLVARNQKTFEYLKSLFQKHEIQKTYFAIVRGVPKPAEGIIEKPIGIKNGTLKRSVRSVKMVKDAITEYWVVKTFNIDDGIGNGRTSPNPSLERGGTEAAFSLLEVKPKTGRTHQIRVHLASIGHPIVGDPLYGPKKQPSWGNRLMLHAFSISFRSPFGAMMTISAESPFEEVVSG